MKSLVFLLTLLGISTVYAQAPTAFTYGGRLAQATGVPQTGALTLTFNLYDSTTYPTPPICTKGIPVTLDANGVFNVTVDFTPADCGATPFASILSTIVSTNGGIPLIEVDDGTTTYPIQAINASPVATYAVAANALLADGSIAPIKLAQPGAPVAWTCAAGEFVTVNGAGEFLCQLPVGQVASVTAGAGLNNSNTAVNPVLDVNTDGVTTGINGSDQVYVLANGINTAQLANNAVTTLKIANDQVTFAKLDNTSCVNGEVLKKAGGVWGCGPDVGNVFAGTNNVIPKNSGGNSLVDSIMTEVGGTEISVTGDVNISGRYMKGGADLLSSEGTNNLALGFGTNFASTGNNSTMIGTDAGTGANGDDNTFVGYQAGNAVTGQGNTYLGSQAGSNAGNGSNNVMIGLNAGTAVTSGNANVLIGRTAANSLTTASDSVLIGSEAGEQITTESQNVMLGTQAGQNNQGSGNVFLGYRAGQSAAYNAFSNTLIIDNKASDNSTTYPLISGDFSNGEVYINHICDQTGANCKDISAGWGLGSMNNFNIIGDAGGPSAVGDADNITYAGGNGASTIVSGAAPNYTVTINAPNSVRSVQSGVAAPQTGFAQVFSVTTATGLASPTWTAPGADQHQLDLPMSSTLTVAAGLLANLDYLRFDTAASRVADGTTLNAGEWCFYNGLQIECTRDASNLVNPTANALTKSSGTAFVDSIISDNGTTATITGQLAVTGASTYAGSITMSGAASNLIIQDQSATLNREAEMYNQAGTFYIRSDLNANTDSLGSIHTRSANVVVGGAATAPADASAQLEVQSVTKGMLAPKMTTAQRDAINGGTFANGLLIYNTTTDKLQYYNGAVWADMGATGAGISPGTANYVTKYNPGGVDVVNSIIFDDGTNVGISNAAPATKLDVTGDGTFGNVAAPTLNIDSSDSAAGNATLAIKGGQGTNDNTFGTIAFNTDNSGGDILVSSIEAVRESANDDSYLIFATRPNAGANTERMRISSTGDVSIGGVAPADKLHVADNDPGIQVQDLDTARTVAAFNANIDFRDSGGLQYGYIGDQAGGNNDFGVVNASNNAMFFSTNNVERMRIQAAGNVGVGATNPQTILHVANGAPELRVQDNDSTAAAAGFVSTLNFRDSANANAGWIGYDAADQTLNIMNVQNNNLSIGTNNTERMLVTANGRIAIGDTSSLETDALVEFDSTNQAIIMPRMANPAGDITTPVAGMIAYDSGDNKMQYYDGLLWQDMDGGVGVNAGTANQIMMYNGAGTNAADSNMFQDGSGNVGLGTAGPNADFEVARTGQETSFMLASDVGQQKAIKFNDGATNMWDIRSVASNDDLRFYSYGTTSDVMTLERATGDIGLGTIAPNKAMHVNRNDPDIRLEWTATPSNNQSSILFTDNGTDKGLVEYDRAANLLNITQGSDTPGAGGIVLSTDNAERMRIDEVGEVGIGTAAPTSQLDIASGGTKSYVAGGLYVLDNSTGGNWSAVIENDQATGNGLYVATGTSGANTYTAFQVDSSDASQTPLRIRKNGGANFITSFENGNVGVGTNAPDVPFHVQGAANTASVRLSTWTAGDVAGLLAASDNGGLIEGGTNGHLVIGIRDNETADSFSVVTGDGNYNGDTTYDNLAFQVNADGDVTQGGNAAAIANENIYTILATGANDRRAMFHADASGYTGVSANEAILRLSVDNYNIGAGADGVDIGLEESSGLFYITRNQDTGSAPLAGLVVNAAGRVGINNTNPDDQLDVNGDIGLTGCLEEDDTTNLGGTCISDARLKRDIASVKGSLEKVLQLNPVKYIWREEFYDVHGRQGSEFGLIAQEVEAIFPELVSEGDDGYKRVRYDISFELHLIAAMREFYQENQRINQRQDRDIASLKAKVDKLESENAQLKARMDRLEKLLLKQ